MISGKKLLYDFDRKYNLNSSKKQMSLTLPDKIAILNEAQEKWFENKVSVAQTKQKVRNDLRVFKEDRVSLDLNKQGKVYLAKYPSNLHTRLNQIALTTKSTCKGIVKEIIPRIIESDDLHEARSNPYRKSDFYYEQLLAVESKDGLIIYTDEAMEIDELYIDYYRRPQAIHTPTAEQCGPQLYYLYNGEVITKDQDFEGGDTYAANDVVDIAVLLATVDTKDFEGFQARLNLMLSTQNLK